MLELAGPLLASLAAGRSVAVATVVEIEGSAPRGVGASMAWDGSLVFGSVAGGCVEGAVLDVLEHVLADGAPRHAEFGIPDTGSPAEQALAVGLSCGGQLRFHFAVVRPGDPATEVLTRAAAGRPARLALTADGFRTDECPDGYIDVAAPRARLIVTGAMAFSAALAAAGQVMGMRVTVVDPRATFLTEERFPGVDLAVEWPPEYLERVASILDAGDAVCVLSHDDRYDAEALLTALRSPAGYVGAMGSRVTDLRRRARLVELGATPGDLARLHSPIGLDLGAVTPEETAVSILAELIRAREGASGVSLRERDGAIHQRRLAHQR